MVMSVYHILKFLFGLKQLKRKEMGDNPSSAYLNTWNTDGNNKNVTEIAQIIHNVSINLAELVNIIEEIIW